MLYTYVRVFSTNLRDVKLRIVYDFRCCHGDATSESDLDAPQFPLYISALYFSHLSVIIPPVSLRFKSPPSLQRVHLLIVMKPWILLTKKKTSYHELWAMMMVYYAHPTLNICFEPKLFTDDDDGDGAFIFVVDFVRPCVCCYVYEIFFEC